jgi:hypothetical protein
VNPGIPVAAVRLFPIPYFLPRNKSGNPEKMELGKVGQPPLSIHNMNNKSKAGAWL